METKSLSCNNLIIAYLRSSKYDASITVTGFGHVQKASHHNLLNKRYSEM